MRGRPCGVSLALLAACLAVACESTPLQSTSDDGGNAAAAGGDAGTGGTSSGRAGSSGECEPGTLRCSCRSDQGCDHGLICLSELCVDARGLCQLAGNGVCDEPVGCPVGTDSDCCASPRDGMCEEVSMGGMCPSGSDPYDCGYCPWVGDGMCDEPAYCPAGTDAIDCCAQFGDGVCEELSMGGECPDGSDYYDCGYCPPAWVGDGLCDEPGLCPEGSDTDCCAHFADGVCEELGMGGECPDGTDFYDCGYCPMSWANNGSCDEVQNGGYCPSNTDSGDCCANWGDGVCEEPAQGGDCPARSDYFDCDYCPEEWVGDGACDEVGVGGPCPKGSDGDDCCATLRDGTCEEQSKGGMCADLTDWYDCGYCPDVWVDDGYCDETTVLWACPEGTDSADCAP